MTTRKASKEDYDKLVDIWYKASVIAHNFIPENYWQENRTAMADIYLPNSETYLVSDNNRILGFIALDGQHLSAIFVSPDVQGKGIGTVLLDFVKTIREQLILKVYKNNVSGIGFYKSKGFIIMSDCFDEATGEEEFLMEWKK